MSTAILVAGMHRSGTSATTGALRLAGVALGRELLGPGEDNPKGYWENAGAVAIHEKLLHALGRSWDDVRELPAGWDGSAAAAAAMQEIHALVESEFSDTRLWAVKDPRLCRFLPLWKRVLAERGVRAVALLVARHPVQVAASIRSRNGWAEAVGALLWMRNMFEAERSTRDLPRAVVTYDRLLADPIATLWQAAERMGVALPPAADVAAEALALFIDDNDRHHRQEDGLSISSSLAAPLQQAYRAYADVAVDGQGWERIQAAAEDAAQAVLAMQAEIDGLAEMAWEWQQRQRSSEAENAKISSDLTAQIRWSEEAVARESVLWERLADSNQQAVQLIEIAEQMVAVRDCAQYAQRLRAIGVALENSWKSLSAALRGEETAFHAGPPASIEERAAPRPPADGKVVDALRNRMDMAMAIEHLNLEIGRLHGDNEGLRREAERAVADRDRMQASLSWRLTAPLRQAFEWIKRAGGGR